MCKGDTVVRVINIMGIKTASIHQIESVGKSSIVGIGTSIRIVNSALEYDVVGMEINPIILGCYSELIPLEE